MGWIFSAQCADLHSVWAAYKKCNAFRRLSALKVSQEGFIYWEGCWTVVLGQFRDNVLLATNAPVAACRELIQEVHHILPEVWSIPIHCNCADQNGDCQGVCLGPVCTTMGYCCARTPEGKGFFRVQLATLKVDWSLRHGPPLLSPQYSYKGYLARIYSGALTNGKRWTHTRAAQILSACAWVQVALLSRYSRADAMRVMHSGIHRAYTDSQHNVQGTLKVVIYLQFAWNEVCSGERAGSVVAPQGVVEGWQIHGLGTTSGISTAHV